MADYTFGYIYDKSKTLLKIHASTNFNFFRAKIW